MNLPLKIRLLLFALLLDLPLHAQTISKNAQRSLISQRLAVAEQFIDAFYSFSAERLQPLLQHSDDSAKQILRYQAWAKGGNYKVIHRAACRAETEELILCDITVEDDLVLALHTGFNVTDTFHLRFSAAHITQLDTSSNDQPIYYEAKEWVNQHLPKIASGPCAPEANTAELCAQAMKLGYQQFYAAKYAKPKHAANVAP